MMTNPLCPEMQILLCSGHVDADGTVDDTSGLQLRALLQSPIEWETLIELALRHNMLPLLYQTLSTTCVEVVPASVLTRLRSLAAEMSMFNFSRTRQLLCLLNVLEMHDIDAITFKGPSLTALLYDNLAFRQFDDVDMLVHPQDIPRARELLLDYGYRPPTSGYQWDETELWQYCHAVYVEHEASQTLVDLHWRLDEICFPFPPALQDIWQDYDTVSLLGTSVKTLQTEDLFLYLCMHGTRHLWYKLGWICDIATLLRRRPGLLNDTLMARVKASGVERMFRLALSVAHRYFHTVLPGALGQRVMADPAVRSLLDEVDRRLALAPREASGLVGPYIQQRYFQFKMRERFRDRQALVFDVARTTICPNTRDREVFSLAPWASWLYYGLKPARLLWQHGRTVCREVLQLARLT